MADSFVAISEDGVRFKLNNDGTWEPDMALETGKECIRFRSSNWGDSVAKVKAAEPNDPVSEIEDWLTFATQVGSFPAELRLNFVNDMLCAGVYGFMQEHADINDFLVDFESLERLLIAEHGESSEKNDYWLNELFKKDFSCRGLAYASGHHVTQRKWKNGAVEINLQIGSDNYRNGIKLLLSYESKRHQQLAVAALERQSLVGL